MNDIDEKTIEYIVRSFWRRIDPHKNDYERELPEILPVVFKASMTTALLHLGKQQGVCKDCISYHDYDECNYCNNAFGPEFMAGYDDPAKTYCSNFEAKQ